MLSKNISGLLSEVELGLQRSGNRRDAETAFLRELMSVLGQQAEKGFSPAQLYQQAFRGDPSLSNLLQIIGTPWQRILDTLQPGDWMIRVAPGTGDVGHVSVLISDDLMSRSRIRNEGIPAESSLPGYYGTVIEGGAYPHDRSTPFARRFRRNLL